MLHGVAVIDSSRGPVCSTPPPDHVHYGEPALVGDRNQPQITQIHTDKNSSNFLIRVNPRSSAADFLSV